MWMPEVKRLVLQTPDSTNFSERKGRWEGPGNIPFLPCPEGGGWSHSIGLLEAGSGPATSLLCRAGLRMGWGCPQ